MPTLTRCAPTRTEATGLEIAQNLGARPLRALPPANFADAGTVLVEGSTTRPPGAVDILLVNPPAPDGAIWIRSQHRVGRRSRENMIWPQVSLAQLAALLYQDYSVEIVDAIPERMTWEAFEKLLRAKQPRYYVTQVTAPTLTNDLRGTFLARSLGATTIAFGTHVTPLPTQTMQAFPSLDLILRGEPELTLVELVDALEVERRVLAHMEPGEGWPAVRRWQALFRDTDPNWVPPWTDSPAPAPQSLLPGIKGLAWRDSAHTIHINPDRPFIPNLDDLPIPLHHLLPWRQYRAPNIRGPYTFLVPSRGCPAGCTFCIKHVSYQYAVRARSPENVLAELKQLWALGLRNVHMYADLFTVNRDHVMGICEAMIREGLAFRWTCNSRVDFVDPEMLRTMRRAGCWLISWGVESASETIRKHVHKGTRDDQIAQGLRWSKEAGIMNWGYFIIGLPGETEATIRDTIDLAKRLPLDLALFHIAAPYPGTPFFFEVVQNGWFRQGTTWEEVDMDESTVLDYPGLPAERIEYWARRAFREWALRPGPLWTFLKSMNSWYAFRSAVNIGWQALGWMR
ncbi:MAG: radical SAM protein [Anaerolineae bacterium]|nr:radical SAM protein [Anaerolineae bacterium]